MLRQVFAVCLIALACQAHADVIVNSSIGEYQVGFGEAGDCRPPFGMPLDIALCYTGIMGSSPWWGDPTLAEEFTGLVGAGLGFPNGLGPRFADSTQSGFWFIAPPTVPTAFVATYDLGEPTWLQGSSFAFASKVAQPVPEPGTLSLFGAGLLSLGLLRRRRRIA